MRQLPQAVRDKLAGGVQVTFKPTPTRMQGNRVLAEVEAGDLSISIVARDKDEGIASLRWILLEQDVVIEQRGAEHFAVYQQGAWERHIAALSKEG